ncbi:dienelactone hydrolase family protein [Dongia sp.]|uniref:dienelactone hydrolase family protein n=1 Tax=Dongia sp. TaxID=1977262 RepID=UPI003753C946
MNQTIIDLYDRYTHGHITRRSFLDRLAVLAGGSTAATAILPLLQNNYALAETVPEGDSRIKTETVTTAGIATYVAKPANGDKFPTVVVIHENRGLNPHIKDVTRRLATEGYLAVGVDMLTPLGGTPADEEKAREMIGQLKPEDVATQLTAVVAAVRARPDSNGKVGAVGFCWGGAATNNLAVADPTLNAAVAYYGRQPSDDKVTAIKAPLLLHYAGIDENVNKGIQGYEAALKANGKSYELHMYEGANHAFNNDTNEARYNKEAADLAWGRTLEFFKKNLG